MTTMIVCFVFRPCRQRKHATNRRRKHNKTHSVLFLRNKGIVSLRFCNGGGSLFYRSFAPFCPKRRADTTLHKSAITGINISLKLYILYSNLFHQIDQNTFYNEFKHELRFTCFKNFNRRSTHCQLILIVLVQTSPDSSFSISLFIRTYNETKVNNYQKETVFKTW